MRDGLQPAVDRLATVIFLTLRRAPPICWNIPWIWLVRSSMPGGAMISTPGGCVVKKQLAAVRVRVISSVSVARGAMLNGSSLSSGPERRTTRAITTEHLSL